MRSEKWQSYVKRCARISRWALAVGILLHFSFFISHTSFSRIAAQESGKASFYSRSATGTRTASGERLHHDSMTCAHRTYPFGTLLRVTNPANDKSVVVRVIDRGPFVRGRIIDLSWGAAKAIGMTQQGIASVIVEQVGYVQVPFRAPEKLDLPHLSLEIHEPVGITPEWQALDTTFIKRQMKRTKLKTKMQLSKQQLQKLTK